MLDTSVCGKSAVRRGSLFCLLRRPPLLRPRASSKGAFAVTTGCRWCGFWLFLALTHQAVCRRALSRYLLKIYFVEPGQ